MPRVKISPLDPTAQAIAKFPNWTTLLQRPIKEIFCDYRANCQIIDGVGQIQIKPGYNAFPIDEIRYDY